MTNKTSITSIQLLLMAAGSALVFPYTFMPILTAPPANQDVWIVLILAFAYILVLNCPVIFLMNKFRGHTLNEMMDMILGKILSKIICFIFCIFFIYCFIACMLIGALYINLYITPETPIWAILLYMLIPISYASYKGAGTIGRLSAFIVPFMMLTIIIFLLIGSQLMNINILKPVLADSTFLQLNQGAFLTGARYSEILIFLVFSYFLKQKSSINKTYISALCVFGIFFFMILIPTITVLGIKLAKHCWNPYFIFTRQVSTYDFIERIQSINTLAWFPAMLLKLMIYNFMASYVLSGIFKCKSHKKFVIPISIIGYLACLLPFMNKSSTVELLRSDQVFPFVVLPVTFVLPIIILIVYLFKKKKINTELKKMRSADDSSN